MMGDPVFVTVIFFLGLLLGSFVNVVLYRLWTHEQFITGRSHCPHCTTPLAAKDLIPLVSFVLLRGRCRTCTKRISAQYPVVEAATGLTLAITAAVYGASWDFLLAGIITLFLITIFTFDLQHKLILDVVSYPFAAFAFIAGLLFGHGVLELLIGGAIGGGFFLVQLAISRGRWVGGGDVKFGLGMGLLLGWEHVLLALFLAYVMGACASAVLLLTRRATAKSAIPFGTFLAVGTYIAMVWAEPLLLFYDHLV